MSSNHPYNALPILEAVARKLAHEVKKRKREDDEASDSRKKLKTNDDSTLPQSTEFDSLPDKIQKLFDFHAANIQDSTNIEELEEILSTPDLNAQIYHLCRKRIEALQPNDLPQSPSESSLTGDTDDPDD